METPVRVVVALAISTGLVKAASVDFCHFNTVPMLPDKVMFAGEAPEQIVWFEDAVPPTDTGLTVIVAYAELALAHTPLCTTALK